VTRLLLDTSVVVKWLHTEGEGELREARAIRAAHVSGELDAHILDLGIYEVGNVLLRALRWSADEVADQLDDLHTILGPPLAMAPEWTRRAASLGHAHALTFYDACWAAAADTLQISLVSADRALLAAGLAESPTAIAARLKLKLR
jgi:predicted nucleic acid-binding protein